MGRKSPKPSPTTELAVREAAAPRAEARPALAVDGVVLTIADDALKVVMIERDIAPYAGTLCLPGGFVRVGEPLEDAVRRVIVNKAGAAFDHLEQLYTFDALGRDPRGHVVSVAWLAIARPDRIGELAERAVLVDVDVPWEGETGGPAFPLVDGRRARTGFDHADVLGLAVQRLRGKLAYTNVGFAFLPPRFTLAEVRAIYETILGRRLNKDSFRRTLQTTHDLVPTGEKQDSVGHRPAELFRLGRRVSRPLSS